MSEIEPTSGRFSGREHLLPIRVYYEDTDFTGLVYHGNYVRYFERGRSDFLRLAGVSHSDLLGHSDPSAFVVTRLAIEFLKAARIDDALTVSTTYDRAKGPRLFISQQIQCRGEVLARAAVEAAFITLDGRPRRPPAGLRERLEPWFATAAELPTP